MKTSQKALITLAMLAFAVATLAPVKRLGASSPGGHAPSTETFSTSYKVQTPDSSELFFQVPPNVRCVVLEHLWRARPDIAGSRPVSFQIERVGQVPFETVFRTGWSATQQTFWEWKGSPGVILYPGDSLRVLELGASGSTVWASGTYYR